MKSKSIFFGCLGGLALLQLFPIDTRLPPITESLELHVVQSPPDQVFSILKNACYDCHSNNTRYPWYAHVQPLGWWMQSHIEEGRSELNFSEFGKWGAAERREVLDHCAALIEKGKMPLRSYLPMHPEARLDDARKTLLLHWLRHPDPGAIKTSLTTAPPDTCDDPDANPRCCFAAMPDSLTSDMTIAGPGEPGERLRLRGRMFQSDGKTPYPGVVIYAYHTNEKGIYAKKGDESGIHRRHGHLHAWCRTDAQGWYSIRTIRPAGYPDSRIPAHIHLVIWKPDGSEPYYIEDTVFDDDPLVDGQYRSDKGRRSGIVKIQRQPDGAWEGKRFTVLKK